MPIMLAITQATKLTDTAAGRINVIGWFGRDMIDNSCNVWYSASMAATRYRTHGRSVRVTCIYLFSMNDNVRNEFTRLPLCRLTI